MTFTVYLIGGAIIATCTICAFGILLSIKNLRVARRMEELSTRATTVQHAQLIQQALTACMSHRYAEAGRILDQLELSIQKWERNHAQR